MTRLNKGGRPAHAVYQYFLEVSNDDPDAVQQGITASSRRKLLKCEFCSKMMQSRVTCQRVEFDPHRNQSTATPRDEATKQGR